jgi:hypothetical protein
MIKLLQCYKIDTKNKSLNYQAPILDILSHYHEFLSCKAIIKNEFDDIIAF